jgi:hypothetical protein
MAEKATVISALGLGLPYLIHPTLMVRIHRSKYCRSFDYFVSARGQAWRYLQSERLRGLQIYNEFKLR